MRTKIICLIGLMSMQQASSQTSISLEDIFVEKKFEAKSVPGFHFLKDGKSYSRLVDNKVVVYDLITGDQLDVLFDASNHTTIESIDGYAFSPDESQILLKTGLEKIYRHSTREDYFLWDQTTLKKLHAGAKQSHASFSPDGKRIAFVSENDLFTYEIDGSRTTQITRDGKDDYIINGAGDWVYEEELVLVKAYEWAPDSRRLAFLRFNESAVKEFIMSNYHDELYPEYVRFKYPKVGEQNSRVEVKIYDVEKGRTRKANLGAEEDIYIPRITWTTDPEQLCVTRLNRLQNALDLVLVNAKSGRSKTLMHEDNKYYIDIHDNLTFLEDGEHFLWTSEMDGFNHVYLYNMKGKIARQLTEGDFDVTAFYGYDAARQQVYIQTAERGALHREVQRISIDGKEQAILAGQASWNQAKFSPTFDYYVLTSSSSSSPTSHSVHTLTGERVRVLEDNRQLSQLLETVSHQPIEFFQVPGKAGDNLNAWMIKPADFVESKTYPLFMFLYGGPGSQMVVDRWEVRFRWWFQHLTELGYIVACVDNRGTGARGQEFKKCTYLQLGKLETEDQIEAAELLAARPYIDADRIGIFGWSYGGYMSTLCLLKGNHVFKTGIAVAPVTNWKWYDTIYTERYMRTQSNNAEGYRKNSPVYFADRLKGDYLLVHGLGDDNVHFQHTAEMATALIHHNKQFDTMFYPNRAHAITGDNARIHLFTKMTNFIIEKL